MKKSNNKSINSWGFGKSMYLWHIIYDILSIGFQQIPSAAQYYNNTMQLYKPRQKASSQPQIVPCLVTQGK